MRAPLERRSAWPTVVAMTLTLLASLLIHAAPTRLPTGADILPLLPLITLFIWAVRRPRCTSRSWTVWSTAAGSCPAIPPAAFRGPRRCNCRS